MEALSGFHLYGLTAFSFSNGFMMANQGFMLASRESERLFPERASLAVALLIMLSGVAQLCSPAAGRWSDQMRANTGRRSQFLPKGAAMVAVLTGVLPLFSSFNLRYCFMACWFLQQVAWNVLNAVIVALVSDFVPAEQKGTAGAFAATNGLVGALCGLLAVLFASYATVYEQYLTVAALASSTVLVVYTTATSKKVEELGQLLGAPVPSEPVPFDPSRWLRELPSSYWIDAGRYPDYSKVLLNKGFYYASAMVKGFLLFFVQDTLRMSSADREQNLLAGCAIASEICAVIAAAGAILLHYRSPAPMSLGVDNIKSHDVVGTARAQVIAIAGGCWAALLWLFPIAMAYMVSRSSTLEGQDLVARWVPRMIAVAGAWGLGQGLYLAGDQALTYALVPDRNHASRYLGLASVWQSVGSIIGGATCGALLHVFGRLGGPPLEGVAPIQEPSHGPGYSYQGYIALFFFSVCLKAAGVKVISTINPKVRMEAELEAKTLSTCESSYSSCSGRDPI